MRNFQDTFETCKRSFISTFSISMTVPLTFLVNKCKLLNLEINTECICKISLLQKTKDI